MEQSWHVETLRAFRCVCGHITILNLPSDLTVSKVIDHLTEEFPQVADYLRSTLDPSATALNQAATSPSQHSQNAASEQLTSGLMTSLHELVERTEAEGREPLEEELRRAVGRAVVEGVLTGYEMSANENSSRVNGGQDNTSSKRPRTDDGPG
jgi:hypothetical protein